ERHWVGASFTGGIIGYENAHLGIVIEGSDVGLAHVTRHAAMDHNNGLMLADALADVVGKIFQRVARLGEDEKFATLAGRLVDHRRLIKDFAELAPLGILAGLTRIIDLSAGPMLLSVGKNLISRSIHEVRECSQRDQLSLSKKIAPLEP